MTLVCVKGERRFKFNKIPRIDTNEVSEIEVTVTTVRHVQAERANKQQREDSSQWRLRQRLGHKRWGFRFKNTCR